MKLVALNNDQCIDCGSKLETTVSRYSILHLGMPLCRLCQDVFRLQMQLSTDEAIGLYVALKLKGIPAELEKEDGYKSIDIAIPSAKINIEVDGGHHNYQAEQALADLKRTYYSFKKGYYTIRIPNSLIKTNLDEATEYVIKIIEESAQKLTKIATRR